MRSFCLSLGADVDSKGRVWWVRAFHSSQKMLLKILYAKGITWGDWQPNILYQRFLSHLCRYAIFRLYFFLITLFFSVLFFPSLEFFSPQNLNHGTGNKLSLQMLEFFGWYFFVEEFCNRLCYYMIGFWIKGSSKQLFLFDKWYWQSWVLLHLYRHYKAEERSWTLLASWHLFFLPYFTEELDGNSFICSELEDWIEIKVRRKHKFLIIALKQISPYIACVNDCELQCFVSWNQSLKLFYQCHAARLLKAKISVAVA